MLNIRDSKKGFLSVLEIFPEVLHLVEIFPQGGHTNRTILSASEKGQAVDKAAELIGVSPQYPRQQAGRGGEKGGSLIDEGILSILQSNENFREDIGCGRFVTGFLHAHSSGG